MGTEQVSFEVSPQDAEIIRKIANRAKAMDRQHNSRARPYMDWWMDITAVHANGNPLRLQDLLDADDFNFAHDAFGIARHLNRENGKLEDFFSPRFSARETEAA